MFVIFRFRLIGFLFYVVGFSIFLILYFCSNLSTLSIQEHDKVDDKISVPISPMVTNASVNFIDIVKLELVQLGNLQLFEQVEVNT
jgi:hypothetical protein